MRKNNLGVNISILLILLISLTILLMADLGNDKSQILDSILDYGHLFLFGVTAIVLIWTLNKRKWPVHNKNFYLLSLILVIILGPTTEVLQTLTPNRYFSLSDILYDILGGLSFLILSYPSMEGTIRRFKIFSLVTIVVASFPIWLAIIDTSHMRNTFPVLDSFESCLETRRWSVETGNEISRSGLYASEGSFSLEAVLHEGKYPGVSLEQLIRDWTGYDIFHFDLFLDGNDPLRLTVRINDFRHDQSFHDRFNRTFILSPGHNHISINLADVKNAPSERKMDMEEIEKIMFFSYRLDRRVILYLDNLRLQKLRKST